MIDSLHCRANKRISFDIDILPTDATTQDIRHLLSGYGNVLSVTLLPNPTHAKQLGIGLVDSENIDNRNIGVRFDQCSFWELAPSIGTKREATESRISECAAMTDDSYRSDTQRQHNRDKNLLRVVSVEQVFDSTTGKPNGWCRYSIKSLAGSVTGLRHGSVAEVTLYAEEAAEAFNQRNMLGNPCSPNWTSRHKKRGA